MSNEEVLHFYWLCRGKRKCELTEQRWVGGCNALMLWSTDSLMTYSHTGFVSHPLHDLLQMCLIKECGWGGGGCVLQQGKQNNSSQKASQNNNNKKRERKTWEPARENTHLYLNTFLSLLRAHRHTDTHTYIYICSVWHDSTHSSHTEKVML